MALTTIAAWLGVEAVRSGDRRGLTRAGVALGAAVLTRYEAWPFAATLPVLAAAAACRTGRRPANRSLSPGAWWRTRRWRSWRSWC